MFLLISCKTVKDLNHTTNCSSKKEAIRYANDFAKKRLGKNNFQKCLMEITDEKSYFSFSYSEKLKLGNVNQKGGVGILFKLKKENCEVYDETLLQ